mgnify:CR=1 FL=1
MMRHIDKLESTKFGTNLVAMQNYREQILEGELTKLRERLGREKGDREKELEGEVMRLTDQRYNLEMLYKRLEVSNGMLNKKL